MKRIFTYPWLGRLRGMLYSCVTSGNVIRKPLFITPKFIKFGKRIVIQKNCRIQGIYKYENVMFSPEIIFHDRVTIQQNLHLTCADRIEIGENTAIAANVTITDINHPYEDINIPIEQQPITVMPVKIGADCKIYNNVVVLPGTELGKHCVIGANSVVKGVYPDFCVIAGAPARIIKRYNYISKKWEKV